MQLFSGEEGGGTKQSLAAWTDTKQRTSALSKEEIDIMKEWKTIGTQNVTELSNRWSARCKHMHSCLFALNPEHEGFRVAGPGWHGRWDGLFNGLFTIARV